MNLKLARALNSASNARDTLVMRRSLDDDRHQGAEVRDRGRRARCLPDRPVDAGHSRSLTDIPTWPLTCAQAGLRLAAHVLLSWWSYFPAPGPGGRPGTPRRYVSPGPRVRDDLVAQVDAFNANRHAGNGDQHVDLRLRFTAETAF